VIEDWTWLTLSSPGHHLTGREEARNLWNVVRSFWQLRRAATESKGPRTGNI